MKLKMTQNACDMVIRLAADGGKNSPVVIESGSGRLRYDGIRIESAPDRKWLRPKVRISFLWKGEPLCYLEQEADISGGDTLTVTDVNGTTDFRVTAD